MALVEIQLNIEAKNPKKSESIHDGDKETKTLLKFFGFTTPKL